MAGETVADAMAGLTDEGTVTFATGEGTYTFTLSDINTLHQIKRTQQKELTAGTTGMGFVPGTPLAVKPSPKTVPGIPETHPIVSRSVSSRV